MAIMWNLLSCPSHVSKTIRAEAASVCLCPVGYTSDTIYFEPLVPIAVDIAEDLQMPQFSLVDTKVEDCSTNYTSGFCCRLPSCCVARLYGFTARRNAYNEHVHVQSITVTQFSRRRPTECGGSCGHRHAEV